MSDLSLDTRAMTGADAAGARRLEASAARTGRRNRGHWIVHVLLAAGAVVMVFPFVWQTLTAFKTFQDSVQVPPVIIPDPWVFTNFAEVFDSMPFDQEAIAYRQLALRFLGDERAAPLCDYDRFVKARILQPPAGWGGVPGFNS